MRKLFVAVVVFLCLFPMAASAAPFTNDDVIEMYKNGVDEDTIIQAVTEAPETAFDMSGKGISALSAAKASKRVRDTMYARLKAAPSSSSGSSAAVAVANSDGSCPVAIEGGLALFAGGKIVPLRYKVADDPENLSALSSITKMFGGTGKGGITLILQDSKSETRITDAQPYVEVLFPAGQRPDTFLKLARLMHDANSRRTLKVNVETSYQGDAVIFDPNALVEYKMDRIITHCNWRGKTWDKYRLTPAVPLEKGEYGFVHGKNVYEFAVD